jgi:hypothetical protein
MQFRDLRPLAHVEYPHDGYALIKLLAIIHGVTLPIIRRSVDMRTLV